MWSRNLYSIGAALLASCGFAAAAEPVAVVSSTTAQVMASGIFHEAFAFPIRYEPVKPVPVSVAPPAIPVEVRPEIASELQEQAVWIPGYWEWDAETDDFIWVSGIWRFPPPGSKWIEGQWVRTEAGFMREPGGWTSSSVELIYVERPPRYKGRFVAKSSLPERHVWIPGTWIPENGRFSWRHGFVAPGDKDFVWIPAHYSWTTKGWKFHAGWWDYPLAARGQAFASLRFPDRPYEATDLRIDNAVPIPSDAIQETERGEFVYRLPGVPDDVSVSAIAPTVQPVPGRPAPVELEIPATAMNGSIRGIVRRGDILVPGITIELVGTGIPPVESNERGEFVFPKVPFGLHVVQAEGAVKNIIRRAFARLEVDEAVEEIELVLK